MPANMNEEELYAAEAVGNADAALTYPTQASALRKGGYAIFKSKPCKILEVNISKPGKHGHAKCTFLGRDVFTGAGIEDTCPSSHNMEVPFVKKKEYDVMHISGDGFLSLLSAEGVKEDIKVPEGEVGEKIRTMLDDGKSVIVTILSAMGQELAVDAKAGLDD